MIKKMLYIAHTDMRSGKASSIQIMNSCYGFVRAGVEVILTDYFFLPGDQRIRGDYWEYFGLNAVFTRKTLPTFLWIGAAKIPGLIYLLKIPALVLYYLSLSLNGQIKHINILYTRCYTAIMFAAIFRQVFPSWKKILLVFEAHERSYGQRIKVLKMADIIVSISNKLADELKNNVNKNNNIIVEHDCVDLNKFNLSIELNESPYKTYVDDRNKNKILCYAGGLYKGEIDFLIECSTMIPKGTHIIVLGGSDSQVKYYRSISNGLPINFLGNIPHKLIPKYLCNADILVMPYTGRLRWSEYFSPMKLFEYMAAKRPIIASDLPVLHEILDNSRNSILFDPGNSKQFVECINVIINNKINIVRLTENAFQDVQYFTWEKRSNRIISFCNNFIGSIHK